MAHLKMAAVTTTEFARSTSHTEVLPFSLIEQKGLASRLILELTSAYRDFARDPRSFIKGLVFADSKDAKRRQRIQIGLACALIAHMALMGVIAVLGWRTIFVKTAAPGEEVIVWVPKRTVDPATDNRELPKGEKKGGSGGGGDNDPHPPTKGPLPQMSERPQVVKPNAPSAPLPTIQLPSTIVGPDNAPPPPGIALGIPAGAIAEAPSPGPGSGEGLGGRKGSGAGPGSGPGSGPGNNLGGGAGGRNRTGTPGGRDDSLTSVPYNRIDKIPDHTGIVWLHRPRPIITPEAEATKVMGEVLLRATFREDGTITDIEIVRQVSFMTESAIYSLAHSTFRPATIKGRPVTVTGVLVRINVDVVKQ